MQNIFDAKISRSMVLTHSIECTLYYSIQGPYTYKGYALGLCVYVQAAMLAKIKAVS